MREFDEMEVLAFETFAKLHPVEAHDTWPDRFWAFFRTECPGVTREQMVAMLDEAEGGRG